MKTITEARTEITIKRPNGEIEIVTPKFTELNDNLFSQIKKATADAGRGECLSYKNIAAIIEPEESDYQRRCERCGVQIDTRTAYHQMEWTRFGGKRIQVNAYYCNDCKQLLTSIGQGEYTDMQARANEKPSYEPYTKED